MERQMYSKKDSKRMLGKPKPLTAKGAPKVAKKKATMTPQIKKELGKKRPAKPTVGTKPMSSKPTRKLKGVQANKVFRQMYGR